MEYKFTSQGHAEDMVMRHRFLYYVRGKPTLEDWEYDELERAVRKQWSVSVCDTVGGSRHGDYPEYISEGRRPNLVERLHRDALIAERWMGAL